MHTNQSSKKSRILAISLSSRGFGYAVLEGNNRLIYFGRKNINSDKNRRVLIQIEKLIIRTKPDVLVLQDVNAEGVRRHTRIKTLHKKVIALGRKQTIKIEQISGTVLRSTLLDNPKGTKQEMAETVAKLFPDELASRLPPPRIFYDSEDARMDIFDATGFAVVHRRTPN